MKNYQSALLARLETQYISLVHLINAAPEQALTLAPAPGKWNAVEQLEHLVRYQQIFDGRVTRILLEDTPSFERYSAEKDDTFQQRERRPVPGLLHQLSTEREALMVRLTQLPESFVHRAGIHPVYGKLTLLDWTEFFLLHEAHHIYAVFELLHLP